MPADPQAKGAVFLSYASQDAVAAKRICEALRAVGVEVWFDQSELVGGDQWDQKIRKQIAECALFVPIISANTQARLEGYFRLEWKIAAQRTHTMADERVFLLPLVIDGTRDADAKVPAEFKSVQWTRLPGGEDGSAFAVRVQKLLRGAASEDRGQRTEVRTGRPIPSGRSNRRAWLVPAVFGVVALGAVLLWQPWKSSATQTTKTATVVSPAAELVAKARALIDDDPLVVRESYKSAVELCERATQLSPDDGEAWATLARANLRLATEYREDTEKRRTALRSQTERAIRLAPDSIEAGLAMAGYELAFEDNVAAARARLLRLVERAPTDRRLLRMLVSIEEDRGQDVQEARRWTERANALPGGDAGTLLSLAWVHWGRNEFPQVREAVEKSLGIRPMTESCQLRLMLFLQSGDLEGARRFLRELPAAILREDRTAMISYEVQLFSGDYEGALRTITAVPRECLEEGLFFASRGKLAGQALLLAGKPNAAKVEFGTALKALDERLFESPRDSRVVYQRAMVLACLGETAKAEQQLATARELGRDDWYEPETCMLIGRTDEALASFARTIERTQSRWPGHLRYLKYDPVYEPLRRTPRGAEILARGDVWLREMLSGGSRSDSAMPAPKVDAKSVAVLAFANLSDDKGNEYFSDGISEELLNVLAKVPGLNVRGRSSGFYFKGKQARSAEIGQQLAVDYLVQGSVRRSGDRVRISAQLIRAATDEVLWSSGSLDRDLKDIFAVQDEIARLIAQNLQLKLGDGRTNAKVVNPEAHRLVLEGRHYLALRGETNFARGETAFRAAAEIAPDMAVAHAGWAELAAQRGRYQQIAGLAAPGSQWEEVQRHAARALQLDPNLSEPHAALAVALVDAGRLGEAEVAMARGIEANPNYGSQYLWRSHLYTARGRLDLALVELQRATDLDPLAFIHLYIRGAHLGYAGRWAEALPLLDRGALLRGERFLPLEGERAMARFLTGRREEAMALARKILADPELFSLGWWTMGEALWVLRQGGAEEEAVRQGEAILAQLAPDNYLRGYVLCCLGRFEEGLPLLRHMPTIARNRFYFVPVFDPARETPSFRRLIADMKVEAEYALSRATRVRILQEQEAKK